MYTLAFLVFSLNICKKTFHNQIIFFIISPVENVFFFHPIIQAVLYLAQVPSAESIKSHPECFLLAIQFWLPLLVLSSLFLMAKRKAFIKPCMYLLKRSLTPFFGFFFLGFTALQHTAITIHCECCKTSSWLFFSLLFQFSTCSSPFILHQYHAFILKLKFSPCLLLTKT